MNTQTLRQCRRCKKIEMERVTQFITQPGIVAPDQTEVAWLRPPDCFEPNLVVHLCVCPTCEDQLRATEKQ